MGLFSHEYPYTDFHELNLDWIITKIKEFENEMEDIEHNILEKSQAYTDKAITERLADVEAKYDRFRHDVDDKLSELDDSFEAFKQNVNAQLVISDTKIKEISKKVDNVLARANEYTNQAIINNNDYIIEQTTKALSGVTVLNYFTGARISIQAMFDYLAKFHLENAIKVSTLVAREKTVDELIALNVSMTDIAINGGTIIV